jgi:small subunit ribosomal protein S11
MGKKRIVTSADTEAGAKKGSAANTKRKLDTAVLNIQSTYNNTKAVLTDIKGNVVAWSSTGALGFKGAKKGTPYAAAKVGEVLADKAMTMGVKEVSVVIKGVGSGRESVARSFVSKGFSLSSIRDVTGVPHNGVKPKKPRRV